jgi:hypothetical protein
MLKSSSLCLHSSNLGTFCLKIEQFWSFEEIFIFNNSGHLEWRAGLSDKILKGNHPTERKISQKNPEYMLNYFCHVAAVKISAHFDLH